MNYDIQCYIMRDDTLPMVNTKTLWPNMWLLESDDIVAYGKPKNIVTESYAESDGLKVWLPLMTVTREATDVKLKMCFIGETRYDEYDSFVTYITGHKLGWRDDVRNRYSEFVMVEKTKPDESFFGNMPYMNVEFTFKNIQGKYAIVPTWSVVTGSFVCEKERGDNTGFARIKGISVRDGIDSYNFNITDSFTIRGVTFSSLTDSAYEALPYDDFLTRVEDFNYYISYTISLVQYSFPGNEKILQDIWYVRDVVSCPLPPSPV